MVVMIAPLSDMPYTVLMRRTPHDACPVSSCARAPDGPAVVQQSPNFSCSQGCSQALSVLPSGAREQPEILQDSSDWNMHLPSWGRYCQSNCFLLFVYV